VLARAIVKEGARAVAASLSPQDIERGFDLVVAEALADIESSVKKVKWSDEIAQVGTISANGDGAVGKIIAEAVQKVGNERVITVEEANSLETELDVLEGLQFDRGCLSPTIGSRRPPGLETRSKASVVRDTGAGGVAMIEM
jgi:chaperonin GroEL